MMLEVAVQDIWHGAVMAAAAAIVMGTAFGPVPDRFQLPGLLFAPKRPLSPMYCTCSMVLVHGSVLISSRCLG